MKAIAHYFWRHPRRTGFILLNLVVLAAFVAWGAFTTDMSRQGIGGVPNLMLGYAGMGLLIVLWIFAWLAWASMVVRRQIARRHS
ncbi:MAG: hypothetical protein ABIQ30_00765 [Devosia sp.]